MSISPFASVSRLNCPATWSVIGITWKPGRPSSPGSYSTWPSGEDISRFISSTLTAPRSPIVWRALSWCSSFERRLLISSCAEIMSRTTP